MTYKKYHIKEPLTPFDINSRRDTIYASKIERIALWVAALETADLIVSWLKMKASFSSLPLLASNLDSTTLITSLIISDTLFNVLNVYHYGNI